MIEFLTTQNIIYLTLALVVLIIILLGWVTRLEVKIHRLMRGKRGHSLEDSFVTMQTDLKDIEKFRKDMEKYLKNVEARLSRSIRGVGNVNFNAFTGLESGGKSFASAFLNEHGDGIILSSLHARDHVSIFSKEVKGYKTEVELSDEEKAALTKAKESCNM